MSTIYKNDAAHTTLKADVRNDMAMKAYLLSIVYIHNHFMR